MNKVNWTQAEGRRIKNDSYAHAFAGVTDALKGILRYTGTGAPAGVRLHGAVVTIPSSNTADVTEGYVYIDGEVYYVPAATGVTKTGGQEFVFKVQETTVSPSLVYYDGNSYDIHLQRRAVLTYEATATAGNYMPYNAPTFDKVLFGEWGGRTFSGAHYTTSSATTWTVTSGNTYLSQRYNALNGTLDISVRINSSTLSATATELRISLEDIEGVDLAALNFHVGVCRVGSLLCYVSVEAPAPPDPGSEYLAIRRVDGSDFASGSTGRIDLSMTLSVYEL